jgi:hypothetical protein
LLSFLPVAGYAVWTRVTQTGSHNRSMATIWLALAAACPVLYLALHFALLVESGPELDLAHVERIALGSFACVPFILAMCLLYAAPIRRHAIPRVQAFARVSAKGLSVGMLAALVGATAAAQWRSTRADVASGLAHRTVAKQPDLSQRFVEAAIDALPYERYYQRQLVFNLLAHAIADIKQLGKSPERYANVEGALQRAEAAARTLLSKFPRDPWSVVALANVRQVQGLRFLRPLAPAAGAAAAAEADALYARAQRMFPVQPLLLRNWAQLKFDQGDAAGAFKLLDAMETLLPHELDAYAERITLAGQMADSKMISAVLARAETALDELRYQQLLAVAKAQQK